MTLDVANQKCHFAAKGSSASLVVRLNPELIILGFDEWLRALNKEQNQNDSSLKQAVLTKLILCLECLETSWEKKRKQNTNVQGEIFLIVVPIKLGSLTNKNSNFNKTSNLIIAE